MGARWFAALIAFVGVIAPAFAQDVSKTNCDVSDAWRAWSKEVEVRAAPGPFRLDALYCQTGGYSSSGFVAVSPDLSSIALHRVYPSTLVVARLSAPAAEATYSFGLER